MYTLGTQETLVSMLSTKTVMSARSSLLLLRSLVQPAPPESLHLGSLLLLRAWSSLLLLRAWAG